MTDEQDRNHSLCCDQIAELLPLYIYDDVSAHERTLIEEHMECCGKCRSELVRLEFVSKTLDLNSDESSSLQPRTAIENMSSLNSVERSRDVYFWVKTCISIAALGLVVIALFGLEIRISGQAVTIGWGNERAVEPIEDDPGSRSQETHIDAAEIDALREELALTRQLVHALAANVDSDRTASRNLYRLIARRLNSVETGVRRNDFRLNSPVNNKLASR